MKNGIIFLIYLIKMISVDIMMKMFINMTLTLIVDILLHIALLTMVNNILNMNSLTISCYPLATSLSNIVYYTMISFIVYRFFILTERLISSYISFNLQHNNNLKKRIINLENILLSSFQEK